MLVETIQMMKHLNPLQVCLFEHVEAVTEIGLFCDGL